jgi:hypothetical protein
MRKGDNVGGYSRAIRGNFEVAHSFSSDPLPEIESKLPEFPHNRAIQVFLAMTLYNLQKCKEAMELVLINLMETTSDEKLQYFKRGISHYALHLDETWG